MFVKPAVLSVFLWSCVCCDASAQTKETAIIASDAASTSRPSEVAEYREKIAKRSADAVAAANIDDSMKRAAAQRVVEALYHSLHDIQVERANAIKAAGEDAAAIAAAKTKSAEVSLIARHSFHDGLTSLLTSDQVSAVKDKMTYQVRTVTYNSYCDMLPSLNDEQKTKIRDWLLEARDEAVMGENSEAKHAVFGRYKGRINNYLSAEGFDLKKAGQEWETRRKSSQTPPR